MNARLLHAPFVAIARATPDASALVDGLRSFTFAEVDARAARTTAALRARGVRRGSVVAVQLEPGVSWVVTVLAVLRAGAAFLPIDVASPPPRVARMLAAAQPVLLVHDGRVAVTLPASVRAQVRVDALEAPAGDAPPAHSVELHADDLAYVVFTSGSTGEPKGVAVSHGAASRTIEALVGQLELSPSDTCLVAASPGFDASIMELFQALAAGARAVVVPRGITADPVSMARLLAQHRVSFLFAVPSLLHALLQHAEARAALGRVRCIAVGAEALPAATRAALPAGPTLHNLYGPTEAAIVALAQRFDASTEGVPIGRALPAVTARVLGPDLQPVSPGEEGELCLAGPQLARGYLGRAAETALRFVPDPFGDGGRLYRTGDRARQRADGAMDFAGRADEQVKLAGHRVELGDVEHALLALEGVDAAAAAVRQTPAGRRCLVGYVVGDATADADRSWRAQLAARLPAYMVPVAIVRLGALPRATSGKVDRAALPPPSVATPSASAAAASAASGWLAGMWCALLGVGEVRAEDDFLELGGDSLLLGQLRARIADEQGIETSMSELFAATRLGDQQRLLAGHLPGLRPARIEPRQPGTPAPLSFSQERVWFLRELARESTAYNTAFLLRFDGRLQRAPLEQALSALVQRHEVLRTTFEDHGAGPVQLVREPFQVSVDEVDVRSLTPAAAEAQVQLAAHSALATRLDVATLPLFRYQLLHLPAERDVLVVLEHHLVHDGWSLSVLLRELGALYTAALAGREGNLPPLRVQYADHAAWQRQQLQGRRLAELRAFWLRTLQGAPPRTTLPSERARPRTRRYQGRTLIRAIEASLAARLVELGRAHGSTLYTTLLTLFCVLLRRELGQSDLVVGTTVAGRTRVDVEALLGMFVNSLPLRVRVEGNPTLPDLLRHVAGVTRDALAHDELPFEKIVEAVNPPRDASVSPLFQVDFNFHDAEMPVVEVPGARGEIDYVPFSTAKFDFSLIVVARPGAALRMLWEYDVDVVDAATVERLVGAYERLLEAALARPGARVLDLAAPAPSERGALLERGQGLRVDRAFSPMHAQVLERARRTPDAVAVADRAQALTYRELDQRSARLAALLRVRGVGPETAVGVCQGRSVELAVALLAVLRAGAVYVALDPAFPVARLRTMVETCGIEHVLGGAGSVAVAVQLGAAFVPIDAPDVAGVDAAGPSAVHPAQLAYVTFTSGSTGAPRAVGVPHGALANHNAWHAGALRLGPRDRAVQLHAIAFDAFFDEVLPLWAAGGTVFFEEETLLGDAAALLARLAELEVTLLNVPTAVFHDLVDQMVARDLRCPPRLRALAIGGERGRPDAMVAWCRRSPGVRVLNLYGPTETTDVAVAQTWLPEDAPAEADVELPIGVPIDNVTAFVVGEDLQLLPDGAIGELCIGGAGVARGYLGQPRRTAERFVPDPFAATPGARMYRTGDRVRWRGDRALGWLGRSDNQVKLRGHRLELGEIERALRAAPGVLDAAVDVRARGGGAALLGWVVSAPGGVDLASVRARLRSELPAYMLPARLSVVPCLPRSAHGKIDRAALREDASTTVAVEPASASGDLERAVVALFAELLELPAVAPDDDFFALGGHSLLAMRLVARAAVRFGVRLTLDELFDGATPRALGRLIEARTGAAAAGAPGRDAAGPHAPAGAGR